MRNFDPNNSGSKPAAWWNSRTYTIQQRTTDAPNFKFLR